MPQLYALIVIIITKYMINMSDITHEITPNDTEYFLLVLSVTSLFATISFIIADVYIDVIGRNTAIVDVSSENVNPLLKYIKNIRVIFEKWPIKIIDDTMDFKTYCFMAIFFAFIFIVDWRTSLL